MRLRGRPRAFGRTHRERAFGSSVWPRFAGARAARLGGGRSLLGLLAVVTAVLLAGLVIRAGGGSHDPEGGSARPGPERVIASGAILVPVPPGWSRSDRAPRLPGVAIADPIVLDNRDTKVQAVVGLLPATSPTLLPVGFVEGMRMGLPRPRSVQIGHRLRGYHYAGLVHPSVMRLVDMYVAPTTLGTLTVACVAEAVESLVDGCWDVVSRLGMTGRGRPLPANRLAAFREVLAARLTALDAVGSRVRRALDAATTRAEQARALAALPPAYREAAASAASLAPRSPAWPSRVVGSLRRTGEAYEAYARSLGGEDLEPYLEARSRLAGRRAALRKLLDRFSTLPIEKGRR